MIKADKEEVYLNEIPSGEIKLIEDRLVEYYKNPNRDLVGRMLKKGLRSEERTGK